MFSQFLNAVSNYSISDRTRSMLIALVLFSVWVFLVVANVPNSADLIAAIKYAIVGTGVLHANSDSTPPIVPNTTDAPALVSRQAGFARPLFVGLLAAVAVWSVIIGATFMTTGCASVGLTPAKSFDQQLAYQYGTVATIRTTAALSLQNHTLKVDDAEHVQVVADQARALLDLAKSEEKLDVSNANARLLLATNLLAQLQTYLNTKGVSK